MLWQVQYGSKPVIEGSGDSFGLDGQGSPPRRCVEREMELCRGGSA